MSISDLNNPLHRMNVSNGLDAILAEEKLRVETELSELRKEDDDEELDTKVFDARVRARVLAVRAKILLAFLLWQRDLLFCVLNLDTEQLHFKDEVNRLRQMAEHLGVASALQRISLVEDMLRQLDRNLQLPAVVESALRQIS